MNSQIDYSLFGEISTQPLSKIRKLIGKNMTTSWTHIPHVTHHDEVDITAIECLRKQLKKHDKRDHSSDDTNINISLLTFIIKATIETLKKFPEFNASLSDDGNTLIVKHYYHIGLAVDTPSGLIVPVIKNADSLSLEKLASEISDLAKRTRNGKLTFADTEGGTFSVTSLGSIGGTGFTPIIKTSELAILGASRILKKVVADGDNITTRPILPLSLSYDHRVIDGAMAARFMTYLRKLLLTPEHLIADPSTQSEQ